MIVNIASVGGLRTEFGLGVYNLTKAALIHLTRQLANEIGPTRVVGIAPGLVKTDFAKVLVDNFGERLASALPTKRLGEPEDIANLAVFLASDRASWITGETYVIDGGAGVARQRHHRRISAHTPSSRRAARRANAATVTSVIAPPTMNGVRTTWHGRASHRGPCRRRWPTAPSHR